MSGLDKFLHKIFYDVIFVKSVKNIKDVQMKNVANKVGSFKFIRTMTKWPAQMKPTLNCMKHATQQDVTDF